MAQYDGSIRINTKIDSKEASAQMMTLENRIVKTADKIASLRSKMDSLKDAKIPTQEYAEIQRQIESTEKKIADLQARQEKFLETGGKANSSVYKKMEYDLEELRSSLPYLQGELQELVDTGKAFTLGENTSEYANLGQQLQYAENDLSVLTQRHDELIAKQGTVSSGYSKLGQMAKKAFSIAQSAISKAGSGLKRFGGFVKSVFSNLTKSAHKSNSSLGTLGARFKSLALSLLIFNQISKAFNAMISGMKQGFGNLYKEVNGFKSAVDGLKASSLTLKNSFAAAFRPLVEIAVPYIQKVIDAIANLMNTIGQFTAAITGQKTYTKAIKQTTEAIEDENKAQNKQLSGLDKLNNLSSGSGGASDGGGSGEMFEEEVPIESTFTDMYQNIKDLIENQDWEGLGAYIAGALNQGLQKIYDVINWDNVGPYITYFVSAFTGAFNGLVDNLDWDLLGRVIGAGINTIVNTLNLLIEGIDWKNLGTKISVGMRGLINEVDWGNLGNLLGSKFMIQWDIFTGFVDDMWRKDDLTGLTGWSELGTHLAEGLNGIFEKIDLGKIGGTIGKAITGLFQSAIDFSKEFEWTSLGLNISNGINQFLENFDATTVAQGASDLVTGILDTLIKVIETTEWGMIGEKIADFIGAIDWGGIVSRLAELAGAIIGGIFATLWELIKEAWTNISDYFLSYIIESLSGLDEDASLWEIGWAIIQGMFNGIIDTIANIGEWIWENIFSPFIEGFKSAFGIHSPSTVMEEMGNFLMEGLLNGIQSLVDAVTEIWEFMKGIAISLWESVKEGISSIINGLNMVIVTVMNAISSTWTTVWNTVKSVAMTVWNGIKTTISTIINGISSVIQSVMNAIKSAWTTVWNAVKTVALNIWNGIKTTISTVINSVKTVISTALNAIKAIWNTVWTGLKTTVVNIFNGIWTAIKNVINSILGGIEGMANGVINGINAVIGALNSIHVSIPDWVPGLGGKSFGIDLGYLSNVSIPRLATGTVVPPNNEFLAVLGDNKREPEVVSPLSTIEQAVENAMRRNGGMGGGEITIKIPVEIDGRVLFELMKKFDLEQYNRTGRPSFQM